MFSRALAKIVFGERNGVHHRHERRFPDPQKLVYFTPPVGRIALAFAAGRTQFADPRRRLETEETARVRSFLLIRLLHLLHHLLHLPELPHHPRIILQELLVVAAQAAKSLACPRWPAALPAELHAALHPTSAFVTAAFAAELPAASFAFTLSASAAELHAAALQPRRTTTPTAELPAALHPTSAFFATALATELHAALHPAPAFFATAFTAKLHTASFALAALAHELHAALLHPRPAHALFWCAHFRKLPAASLHPRRTAAPAASFTLAFAALRHRASRQRQCQRDDK